MQVEILYRPSYSMANITLAPNEEIRVEAGSMVSMSPGVSIDWGPLALNGFLIAALYSMGILSLVRRPGSLPANLLHWLFFLCALEVAQPFSIIGAAWLTVATVFTSLLLNTRGRTRSSSARSPSSSAAAFLRASMHRSYFSTWASPTAACSSVMW